MAFKLNTEKFKLVGGSVSADFVNTVAGRFESRNKKGGRDYLDSCRSNKLESYADLVAWGWSAKLLDDDEAKSLLKLAAKNSHEAEKVLKRALMLRESVYRLFKAAIEKWKPEAADLKILNKELSVANKYEELSYGEKGFGWEWNDRAGFLDSILWQITSSAAETLACDDLLRLRQCLGDACGWIFLDTSRNRSRQWCDMKDCGNLAKVRRFRQKNQ